MRSLYLPSAIVSILCFTAAPLTAQEARQPDTPGEEESVPATEPASETEQPESGSEGEENADQPRRPSPTEQAVADITDAYELENSLVTATRTPTAPEDIGSSFSLITDTEIRNQQHTNLPETLRGQPGMDVRRQGGPGAQTSLFTRGTESNHTKIMLDGMDLADPAAGSAIVPLEFLDTVGVGRIETLRGPESSVWGSDAIGGVVNMITPKGDGPPSVTASQEAGSFSTLRSRLASDGGDDTFNYHVYGAHLDTQGISHQADNDETDPFRNSTVGARFGVNPTDYFEINFYARHIDSENEYDSFNSIDRSETDARRSFLKLQPRLYLLGGKWTSTLNLVYTDHDRDTVEGSSESFFDGRTQEVDWQNDIELGQHQLLTWGIEYRHESGSGVSQFSTFDDERDVLGFYVQDQISLLDERLTITPSLRVDRYSDFGAQLTGQIAGAYELRETNTIFRTSVGTGFNAPAFDELGSSSGNPELDPEESFGFDAGFEQAFFGDRLTAGATYFYNDIDDLITVDTTPGGGFQAFNVERAVTQGVETFAEVEPIDRFTVRGTYTYTDTEAEDIGTFSSLALSEGGRLLRRPLHKAGVDFSYTFLQDRANTTLSVLYVGERDDVGGTGEAYTLVNLAASYQVTEFGRLFGRIENLLDEDYQDVVGFNSPGIAAYGGLELTF